MRTVRSSLALTSRCRSAATTEQTPWTSSSWPSRMVSWWPVWGSQIRLRRDHGPLSLLRLRQGCVAEVFATLKRGSNSQ